MATILSSITMFLINSLGNHFQWDLTRIHTVNLAQHLFSTLPNRIPSSRTRGWNPLRLVQSMGAYPMGSSVQQTTEFPLHNSMKLLSSYHPAEEASFLLKPIKTISKQRSIAIWVHLFPLWATIRVVATKTILAVAPSAMHTQTSITPAICSLASTVSLRTPRCDQIIVFDDSPQFNGTKNVQLIEYIAVWTPPIGMWVVHSFSTKGQRKGWAELDVWIISNKYRALTIVLVNPHALQITQRPRVRMRRGAKTAWTRLKTVPVANVLFSHNDSEISHAIGFGHAIWLGVEEGGRHAQFALSMPNLFKHHKPPNHDECRMNSE